MHTQQPTKDFLSPEPIYIRAETGQRVANYVIDVILFYVLVTLLSLFINYLFPNAYDDASRTYTGIGILDTLLWTLVYVCYMALVEGLFYGKSLGKLITGTRAVNRDGSRISAGTALTRSCWRAIPFSIFSAFGTPCNPWHDDWTNTMVIDEKASVMK